MKIFSLLLVIFASVPTYSSPGTCRGELIDNRRPTFFNEETQTHIMRDQGTNGWCYAYSSADMVTHYLARNNPEALRSSGGRPVPRDRQLINPLTAIASSSLYEGENFGESSFGGQPNQTVLNMFSDPSARVCLETDMFSTNFRDHQNNVVEISTALNDVDRLARADQNSPSNGMCQSWSSIYSNVFPGLTFSEFSGLISKLSDKSVTNFDRVSALIQRSCKNPVQVGNLPPVQRVRRTNNDNTDNSEAFISAIETQLQNGNIVALEYFQDFLEDASLPPIQRSESGRPLGGSAHVSTIVGRKCVNGEEKFLIRNSFGSGCEIYDQSLECEHGNIWVSRELLLRMSSRISYL